MSRIGKKPIPVPDKVKVDIKPNAVVVTGPKGSVTNPIPPGIKWEQKDKQLVATRPGDTGADKAFHGLARALVANAVRGVTEGFSKELEIVGVGYRAEQRKSSVLFTLGYSHPIEYPIPPGINITVDKQTRLVISGVDRQQVGQIAANIRALRKPDPYKNKGIRYVGEVLKKKAGKAGGK
ncbi:MAG: 50S ribosomal protein L6 [Acidobacteria bacterium]|nr:MAG: 50S ribosomal protein L6 [Acidobacteriota bacterium]PYS13957.1 MAG: 50S ribosomal protein L6 [Acidobacteriota bacterium]